MTSPFILEKDGKTYKIGLQVCEDVWSGDYQFNPTEQYVNQQCDFIINISQAARQRYEN
jgi:NAD+ synthase (glutamine-hydrolysing)